METQMKLEHKIELRWLILFALPTIFSNIFGNLYGNVMGASLRGGWTLAESLRNKQEYRITTSVPDAKTQSRTCENKLPCVFLAPERAFYEFFEIDFWEKRAMGRI